MHLFFCALWRKEVVLLIGINFLSSYLCLHLGVTTLGGYTKSRLLDSPPSLPLLVACRRCCLIRPGAAPAGLTPW